MNLEKTISFVLCILSMLPLIDAQGNENSISDQNFSKRVNNVIYALGEWHVSPLEVDDTLSSRVYTLFMEDFDPYLLFLTSENEAELRKFKFQLDEEIRTGNFSFIDSCTEIIYNGIQNIEDYWSDEVTTDYILAQQDSVLFTKDRSKRLANDLDGLQKRFKKWISYRALNSTYNNFPNLNLTDKDSVSFALTYSLEQEKSSLSCMFKAMGYPDKNKLKLNIQNLFLNNIAGAFDPHSNFFSVDQKNQLETMLSPSEDSFGIYLMDEDNSIKIYSMHQHSDAWRSNLLNVGDIVKQAIDQDGRALIDNCTSSYELEDLLASTSVETVTLTVIKSSGKEINVDLVKESLSSEDNNLVAYVLKGESNIGYISLPSFYTSWELGEVNGCANDVAKEIIKLREDNIEGLVLDLRNNGGGSVVEALDLAGIFIDIGPLGIVKSAQEKPRLMKDFNRGSAYTGPLVVLINGGSASASEIVAGALKYHKRALIVGSGSFGKATGQVVIPTDSTLWDSYPEVETDDYVKVTISNIYQPDLSSHQLYGIQPDIYLPNLWESFYTKEADEYYPLVPDKIQKNVYFTPTLSLPIEELSLRSKERVDNSEVFTRISAINDSLTQVMNKPIKVDMNLSSIYADNEHEDEIYNQLYNQTELDSADFSFNIPTFYKSIAAMDKTFQKNAARLKYELEKDPILNETFLILTDFINLKK